MKSNIHIKDGTWLTFRCPPDLYHLLEQESKKTNTCKSEIVRQATFKALRKKTTKWKILLFKYL